MAQTNFTYANITTNTTANFESRGDFTLHSIVVNNAGTTWVITIWDGPNGTGTKVGTITGPVAGGNYVYDVDLTNGFSVVTSGTTPGDITVAYG